MAQWTMLQAQRDFRSGALLGCEIQRNPNGLAGADYIISLKSAFGSEGLLVDGRAMGTPTRYFKTIVEAHDAARKIGFPDHACEKHAQIEYLLPDWH